MASATVLPGDRNIQRQRHSDDGMAHELVGMHNGFPLLDMQDVQVGLPGIV
jgi:hypothetical protein